MKFALVFLVFLALPVHAAFQLALEGEVLSVDEKTVTLRKEKTWIRVPRETVQTPSPRPGAQALAVVGPKTAVESGPLKEKLTK